MLAYVLRRFAAGIPTLLAIVTCAFLLMRLAPGSPFEQERGLPPQVKANLEAAYGLDQPIHVQYARYVLNLLRGDLGPSLRFRDRSVNELLARGFPVSASLGAWAILLAVAIGVPLGMFAALARERWPDHLIISVAVFGVTIPSYVIAPLLAMLFGIYLHWLPVAGYGDGSPRYLTLPVVTLSLPFIAYVARLTRGSLIEVLRAPFILTARAKGLPSWLIVTRHALKPTLLPVVSYLGPAAAGVLTGSLVIEQVFGLPGIGRYFVQGAINRDYTLVMGVVVCYAALIIVLNIVVDVSYRWLDPKVAMQ
jgi:oligopeptide transport system permease protein